MRRLDRIASPTMWLWMVGWSLPLFALLPGPERGGLNEYLLTAWLLPVIMAVWVVGDARRCKTRLVYDYDTFLFWAWPILIPIYLFKTRGWRALLTIGAFLGLWVLVIVEWYLLRLLLS